MGKIRTRTKPVIWPSIDAATAWSGAGNPPYVDPDDVPPGYAVWGEVVTPLPGGPNGQQRYRARAYFLPKTVIDGKRSPGRESGGEPVPFRDASLKWLDFEPTLDRPVPSASGGTNHLSKWAHPTTTWWFDVADGALPVAPPADRRLTEADVDAERRAIHEAATKHVVERNEHQAKIRRIRAEERASVTATREEWRHLGRINALGGDPWSPENTAALNELAEAREERADQLLELATTEDDLRYAGEMLKRNQEIGYHSTGVTEQVAAKLEGLIYEAAGILDARAREKPNSPIEEWRADLDRLQDRYREYSRLVRTSDELDEDVLGFVVRWAGKIQELEEQAAARSETQRRPTPEDRGLPRTKPDAGIGSEERGTAGRSTDTRASGRPMPAAAPRRPSAPPAVSPPPR